LILSLKKDRKKPKLKLIPMRKRKKKGNRKKVRPKIKSKLRIMMSLKKMKSSL
jgi:hypothetical protein